MNVILLERVGRLGAAAQKLRALVEPHRLAPPHERHEAVVEALLVFGGEGRHDQRQDEEQPDAEDGRDAQHQGDAALADLDALVLRLEAGGADEPAGANDQGLVQDDEPADDMLGLKSAAGLDSAAPTRAAVAAPRS